MTQPCHKDTTLNQQCCDSKHKTEEESRAQFHHRTSPPTTNTTPQDRRGMRTIRGEQTMRRGARQHEMPYPIRTRDNTQPTPPPFNETTTHTRRGTPTRRRGTPHTRQGRPSTQPPFTHHATHHPLCHPTIHNGPTHHHDEGGSAQRIPHHTNTTHPHTTHHTPHTRQRTMHDMTAVSASTAMG